MLKEIQVTLKGVTALLENAMSMDDLLGLRDKTRKRAQTAEKPSLEEEAKSKLHFDPEGRPCVTVEMLLACLIEAGVFIRLDKKRQLSTKTSTLLPGLLTLEDENYPLLEPGADGQESKWGVAQWRYEVRKGINPNGAEAVCIVRPMFERWAIVVRVLLDLDELPEGTYRRLFDLAGQRIGLGDYRPSRKGRFGMFRVECWRELEHKKAKKAAA